jgi:hypothetical protein
MYTLHPVLVGDIVHGICVKFLMSLSQQRRSRIASSILPSHSPALFPSGAIERVFAQLFIHRIVRLTHPRAKLASARHPRCVLAHPALKVLRAHPAWVELAECGKEGLGLIL